VGEGKKSAPDDLVLADAHFKGLGESLSIAPNLADLIRKADLSSGAKIASALNAMSDRLMDLNRSLTSQLCHEPLIAVQHLSDSLALARSQCMVGLETMREQMRFVASLSQMRGCFLEFTEIIPLQPHDLKLPDFCRMPEEVAGKKKP
jgi:hypothetical protein